MTGFPPETLEGPTLTLRSLHGADSESLAAALADPAIWALHPAKERGTPDGARAYARWLAAAGGAMLIRRRADGAVVGTSRYYRADDLPEGAWAIGYTALVRALWGGAANRELKTLMLAPLFEVTDEAWFHIAPGNIRSQRATAKLGAVRRDDGPDGAQRWRLRREGWSAA